MVEVLLSLISCIWVWVILGFLYGLVFLEVNYGEVGEGFLEL